MRLQVQISNFLKTSREKNINESKPDEQQSDASVVSRRSQLEHSAMPRGVNQNYLQKSRLLALSAMTTMLRLDADLRSSSSLVVLDSAELL